MTGGFDRRAAAACMSSAREAENVRWSHYRAVWAYVEGTRCRREALLGHFGDPRRGPAEVPCCDVCAPELAPVAPVRAPAHASRSRSPSGGRGSNGRARSRAGAAPIGVVEAEHLDEAILDVVVSARPPVGRTRAVEILRGGRSKVVAEYAYDALAGYGRFAHLRSEEVLGRVDGLLDAGRLHSTGGRFPKLRAA
jgi:ATP-dependent DNA helicase RecQ